MAQTAPVMTWAINAFKGLFPDPMNNRPTMDINERHVEGSRYSVAIHTTVWDYESADQWYVDYQECAGKEQSPIDFFMGGLPPAEINVNARLEVDYSPRPNLVVINTGYTMQVAAGPGGFGTLTLTNGVFEAVRLQFHFPSEHTIDGQAHAGELHVIHQKEGSTGTDDLAIIGFLLSDTIDLAEAGVKLSFFMENMNLKDDALKNLGVNNLGVPDLIDHKNPPEPFNYRRCPDVVDLNDFSVQLQGNYWHYHGSQTTPPCSETVEWFVMQNLAWISADDVSAFKAIFPDPQNSRPLQTPMSITGKLTRDGRTIEVGSYTPRSFQAADWSYADENQWGGYCTTGTEQSPIVLPAF
jgi:carbonic anhydrase